MTTPAPLTPEDRQGAALAFSFSNPADARSASMAYLLRRYEATVVALEARLQPLDAAPSPEALDLRHAGRTRILNPDEDRSTLDGAYAADEPVEGE